MALSAPGDALQIGVIGSSEDEAMVKFHAAREKWRALLGACRSGGASSATGPAEAPSA